MSRQTAGGVQEEVVRRGDDAGDQGDVRPHRPGPPSGSSVPRESGWLASVWRMSTVAATTVASIVGGAGPHRRSRRPPDLHQPRPHRRGRGRGRCSATRRRSSTPARAARAAQQRVGRGPRAGARPRDRAGRPPRRGQQGGARARSSRARSASPTPSRSARCRRSSTPATSSSARAGGCTGRPCRRRCRTSSSSRSACRSAWRRSSPPATSRSPCRPGTSCRRSCAATRSCGSRPSTRAALGDALAKLFHAGGVPGGVLNLVQASGADTFAGLERALDAGPRRQGRLHRLERGRLEDRRAVRPPPAVAVPRARRQEPDGRDGRRRRRPRGRGRAVRRLRHGGPALHVARHGDRARVGPRRVRAKLADAAARRRRSATRRATSSTGR